MYKSPVLTFFGDDELYPTKETDTFDGRPEFELLKKTNWV